MVLEIVQIQIKPGMEAEFEENFVKALPLYAQIKGWVGTNLQRSIEHPGRYVALVEWESVEDHMVEFRESEAFQGFRNLVGHCFDGATIVEHGETVVSKKR